MHPRTLQNGAQSAVGINCCAEATQTGVHAIGWLRCVELLHILAITLNTLLLLQWVEEMGTLTRCRVFVVAGIPGTK